MERIKLSDNALNLLQELNEARRKAAALEKQVHDVLLAETDEMLAICNSIGYHSVQLFHSNGSQQDIKDLLCDLADDELIRTVDNDEEEQFDLKIDGIPYCIVVDKPGR